MIKILFFASLKDQVRTDTIDFDLTCPENCSCDNIMSIAKLKRKLVKQSIHFEILQSTSILVSVNHEMANDMTIVNEKDEIAFFPAVSGG